MRKKGIATIIEALVSSLILIAAFSIAFFFINTPSIMHQRYSEDLTKVGYNMLSSLAANDAFDDRILDMQGNVVPGWEQELKVVFESLLPANIIFNVIVYNATPIFIDNNTYNVNLIMLGQFGNSNEDAFLKAGENAETSYIYTTRHFQILVISLKLAILGGA